VACSRLNFTLTFTFYMISYDRWQKTVLGTNVQSTKRKSKDVEKLEGVFF